MHAYTSQMKKAQRAGTPAQQTAQARFQDDFMTAKADMLNDTAHAHQLKAKAAQLQAATRLPCVQKATIGGGGGGGGGTGGGLPAPLKSGVESLSGMSMDHVRVHYNSAKPAQLNAHAYTQGSDIHVAPGQEKHLAHEAWHVVQQAQGRVQPTTQMAGMGVNANPGLEAEADSMAAQAMSTSRATSEDKAVASLKAATSGGGVAQLKNRTEIHYQGAPLKWAADDVTPHTQNQQVGIYSTAFLDPEDPVAGYEAGGSPGGVYSSPDYKALNHNISLVQGHLLNANLGGKSLPTNLFPITTAMNHAHSARVEEPAKDMLLKIHQNRLAEMSSGQNDQPDNTDWANAHTRAHSQETAETDHKKAEDLAATLENKFGHYAELVAEVKKAANTPSVSEHGMAIAAIKGAAEVPHISMDELLKVVKKVAHYATEASVKMAIRAKATKDRVATENDVSEIPGIYRRRIKHRKLYGPSVTDSTEATPDNIAKAFSTYDKQDATPGSAGQWGHARVYYAVKVVAPGIGGTTMRPSSLNQTQFQCTAFITQNDGITRNPDENFLKTTIMDNSLNQQLSNIGFNANNYSVFQFPGTKESVTQHL